MSAIVMCVNNSVNADEIGNYLLSGIARNDSWNWITGKPVYGSVVGTTGNTLTQTISFITNSVIQIIGVATGTNTMIFNPQLTQLNRSKQELFNSSLYSDPSLIAYYRFNFGELTTDSKGAFTLTNNNSVAGGTGKFGGGADFGGSNSKKNLVTSSNIGISGASPRTISCWLKYKSDGRMVAIGEHTDGKSFNIRVSTSGTVIQYNVWGAGDIYFTPAEPFVVDRWYHFAMIYNGSVLSGYLDGRCVGRIDTILNTTNTQLYIGSSTISATYISGIIDDVAVFTRALSDDEIFEIYSGFAIYSGFLITT